MSNDNPSLSPDELDPEPFHGWFGLSYANYLVVPRRVLQSMPPEWQAKMIALLGELDASIDWMPEDTVYDVRLCVDKEYGEDEETIEVFDPNREYRHAPKLPLKNPKTGEAR